MIVESMGCHGDNDYVKESILHRLYSEAPVNAIWEDSDNVQCLDVLCTIRKSPKVLEVFANYCHWPRRIMINMISSFYNWKTRLIDAIVEH